MDIERTSLLYSLHRERVVLSFRKACFLLKIVLDRTLNKSICVNGARPKQRMIYIIPGYLKYGPSTALFPTAFVCSHNYRKHIQVFIDDTAILVTVKARGIDAGRNTKFFCS